MAKIFMGLLIGLGAGLALGIFAIDHAAITGDADQGEATSLSADAEAPLNVASLKLKLDEATSRADGLRKASEQRVKEIEDLRAQVARLEHQARSATARTTTPEGLRTRAASASSTPGTHEQSTAPAATDTSETSEQSAEARKQRAETLKRDLERAIASKDKSAALAAIIELRDLGPDTYAQYFAAYEQLSQVGNPWGGKNPLGLSRPEFSSISSEATHEYALRNPTGNVPLSARVSAAYSIAWARSLNTEEKVDLLATALSSATDDVLIGGILNGLGQLGSERAVPSIIQIATNTNLSVNVRKDAIETLKEFLTDDSKRALEQLRFDPEAEVARAAERALLLFDSPVSGYVITSVMEGRNADASGLQSGDVLVSYNGMELVDADTLNTAKNSVQENTPSVPVVVYRNGARVTLNVKPGQLGIMGGFVKK